MRLIITGVSIDEKEVSVLDHKVHKIMINVTTERLTEPLVDKVIELIDEAISTLNLFKFRKL